MNAYSRTDPFASVNRIRTLGPTGTNCEAAARHWLMTRGKLADIVLHRTLEEALDLVLDEPQSALLGCVVYPELHNLVFPFLDRMRLADVFLFNTFNMVLATRRGHADLEVVATHPAPQSLAGEDHAIVLASSNAEAARMCSAGETDACITTVVAMEAHGLQLVRDFGKVPMGFTIHLHQS